eukprot:scaffold9044_cov114-Skeletonema_dohrnii-CCMP3373.AAC.1
MEETCPPLRSIATMHIRNRHNHDIEKEEEGVSPAVPDVRIIGAIKTNNRMFPRNNSNKNLRSLSGSGRRSALPKSMARWLLAIPMLLNLKTPLNSYRPKSSTPTTFIFTKQEEEQYMYMYNQRRALINESSMIDTGCNEAQYDNLPSRFMQHYFGNEIQILKSWSDVSSWNETERVAYLREFANPTQQGHGQQMGSGGTSSSAI